MGKITAFLLILASLWLVKGTMELRQNAEAAPLLRKHQKNGTTNTGKDERRSYIISLRANTTREELRSLAEILRAYHNESVAKKYSGEDEGSDSFRCWEFLTKGIAVPLNATILQWVRRLGMVEYVEEEGFVHAATTLTHKQAHLDILDKVKDNMYTPIGDGRGVDVYVLDTGVQYNHPEFGGRAKFGGRDFVSPSGDGSDPDGHGTYVSSLVAGTTYGVAKAATIYSIRVLQGTRKATVSTVNEALNYVGKLIKKRSNRRAVVLCAFTGGKTKSVNNVVDNLVSLGAVVVAAAGNEGGDACNNSPASAQDAITVGATNKDKRVWYFRLEFGGKLHYRQGSCVGPCVDLFAVGEHVYGAVLGRRTGTSGSAAQVAGVVAVILQLNPQLTPSKVKNILINASVQNEVNLRLVEKQFHQTTPNRFLALPGISLIKPVTVSPTPVIVQQVTTAPMLTPKVVPSEESELREAASKWPTIFALVENRTLTVHLDNLTSSDIKMLYEAMKLKNYTIQYLSYSGLATATETKFIAIFKRTSSAFDVCNCYLGLNTTEVEELLEHSVQVTNVQFFVGYRDQGTKYMIFESQRAQSFIAILGQDAEDTSRFKAIMENANYLPAAHAIDSGTQKIYTYYFSTTRSRRQLYAFGNVQLNSLLGIIYYLRIPIVYVTSYQKENGQSRFLAIFDRAVQNWKDFKFLHSKAIERQLATSKKSGFSPILITPYVDREHITEYIALLLKDTAF